MLRDIVGGFTEKNLCLLSLSEFWVCVSYRLTEDLLRLGEAC